MENAQELYENQKFKLLVPPLEEEEYARLGELKEREIIIPDNENFYDLIIPGVGFMHIRGNNLIIKLNHWLIYNIWIKHQNRMWICRSLW